MAGIDFDRGTLLLDAPFALSIDGAVWDERVGCVRTPAHRFGEIAARADALGIVLEGDLRRRWETRPRSSEALELRPYQRDALAAWSSFGRRGIVALPTGAGKTRVAIAIILELGVPTVILCPTRALLTSWAVQLSEVLREPIGMVGDGERRVERITVMTFESAYRQLDAIGDRFALLVVDEVHHFASGVRMEALEACAAPYRLGLSATAPLAGSDGAARLAVLVGPVVLEVAMQELVGTHLAALATVRVPVQLAPDERLRYERLVAKYQELRRDFFRRHPGADFTAMLRGLAETPEGRQAVGDYGRASDLAYFPRAKQLVVKRLLERHRADRSIVFTARAEDAYAVAEKNLIPAITAEVKTRERERILTKFREGRIMAIASARVLNEGIDVPDARVAIVVAGTLGAREHVQRIGRVLRPAPGKSALAYEIFTEKTMDERNAWTRGMHAPKVSA